VATIIRIKINRCLDTVIDLIFTNIGDTVYVVLRDWTLMFRGIE
jgi:hypothetical protein